MAVVPVILQGAFRDAEDAANLLTGQVQFISDGRAVRVDQNIDGTDGFDDVAAQFLDAALSRVMISSVMLQAFYQVLFQKLPDVVVPEQYFIPQGRIGDDAGGAIVLQGSLGDAQGLADLLGRKPPDSCRLGGEGMERRHSLQKTLKVRLHLFIGARFHKDAIHNAEGLGDFCVKDVQDNPSLQKTIPMSAPDRSSPLKGKNDRR